MSPFHEALPDDRQLVRYLLGLLSERETRRLDEASIADDEVASRLVTVENDLVDAYVSGTIEPAFRHRFETFYLATPRRRGRVEFARRFLEVVDRSAEGARPASPNPSGSSPDDAGRREAQSPWSTFRSPLIVAAALVLLMVGAIGLQNLRLRQDLSRARTTLGERDRRARDLSMQLEASRREQAETTRALEGVRASLSASAQGPVTDRPPGVAKPSRPVRSTGPFAVLLFPQTRSLGTPPWIAVRQGAERVAFELRLESADFPRYRGVLKDPGTGRVLWRSETLSPEVERGAAFVSVDVPARVLGTQHYSLEVEGIDATGHGEIIGSYTFQVGRR